MAAVSLKKVEPNISNIHSILGITVVVSSSLQRTMGMLFSLRNLRFLNRRIASTPSDELSAWMIFYQKLNHFLNHNYKYFAKAHQYLGRFLVAFALSVVYTGLIELRVKENGFWFWVYRTWLAVVAILFLVFETRHQLKKRSHDQKVLPMQSVTPEKK